MEPMEDNSYNDDNFYKGLLDSIRQQSATAEGFNMTSDDFLSKYIEKVDRDQSDLRNDIRESERRISERTAAIEERMDNRLNRIEDMISSQGGKIDDTNKWIIALCISTILGIAAMVVTIILTK